MKTHIPIIPQGITAIIIIVMIVGVTGERSDHNIKNNIG